MTMRELQHSDTLHDLVPFGNLNNAKNVLLACNFTESDTHPWVFFTFFKLYKWYQITQHIKLHFLRF